MQDKMEILVSTVLTMDNIDSDYWQPYLKKLHDHLNQHFSYYEIIVFDGGPDNSRDLSPLQKDILKKVSSIRWMKMSFSEDPDVLFNAGIENAIGDYIIFLRAGIDPIKIVYEMVRKCSEKDSDIIVGVAKYPKTLIYKMARVIGQRMLGTVNYHLPENATPVRCLSRNAINTILMTGQNKRQSFLKTSLLWPSIKGHQYELEGLNLLRKKTFVEGVRGFLKLLIFHSTRPLRWATFFGAVGSLLSFSFFGYSILINFIKNDVVEGWTTIVFFFSFLFMVLFVILLFLGEYMERLLREISHQHNFHVSNEQRSSFMLETNRFNVFDRSKENS